ncbi:MAG: DUF4149 domain-containing protein, partial [Candidatus Eremiobacteraeota bacterium]|nr:DUF4149 domain-containing protein [Candidatus Eremiobacteraeota bacterium]
MPERVLTALECAALGLWAGALAGFAFVVAPLAIRIVTPLDSFAALVSAVIRALGTFGATCGGIAVASAGARALLSSAARPLAFVRIALIIIGIGASAYETSAIVPQMEATARRIPGAIDSVPKSDPRRAAYDAEHAQSSKVYSIAFLCVLI